MREVINGEDHGFKGPAKRCSCCGEVWPKDEEFFSLMKTGKRPGKWHSWCRACVVEWTAAKRWADRGEEPKYPPENAPGSAKYHASPKREVQRA